MKTLVYLNIKIFLKKWCKPEILLSIIKEDLKNGKPLYMFLDWKWYNEDINLLLICNIIQGQSNI